MVYTVTRPCTLSLVKQWCSLVHRHPAGSHSQIICPVMVAILLGVDNSMSLVLQAIKKGCRLVAGRHSWWLSCTSRSRLRSDVERFA